MRQRWLRIASLFAALLAASPPARGEPAEQPRIWLQYRAADECLGQAAFVALVDAKTSGIAWSPSASAGTNTYDVTIDAAPTPGRGYQGTLRKKSGDDRDLLREVQGSSCHEVESALAFILAVDLAPQREREDPASIAAGQRASTSSTASPPSATALTAPKTPSISIPMERARWLSAGVDLGGRSGLGKGLAPQIELVAIAQLASAEQDQRWGRAHVRTSLGFSSGAPTERNGASIALSLWTARVEGCFPRGRIHRAVLIFPCASIEGGVLVAAGESANGGRTRPGAWFAPGASGRVQWQVSSSLFLGSEIGAVLPLVRDDFYFTRREQASLDVPWWGARLTFGATMFFL